MGDFIKLVGYMIEEKEGELTKDRGSWFKSFQPLIDHYKRYGTKYIEKAFRWCVITLSRSFVKEGEWIVKDSSFKVPTGSHLIIKQFPGYEPEEEFNKWVLKRKSDAKKMGMEMKGSDTYGVQIDKLKEAINDYSLDGLYDIHIVDNRFEAWDIVKKEFSSR